MTTPFPFVSGQVLTAAQLNDIQNLPISDKTASYTLLVTDVFKRTIMNSASATTITVDDAIFTESDVIQVANKGAGTTQLAQELAVEGVEHTITVSGGHSLMFFTSPTVIVYELILDDAVFGILDAENVLG